MCIYRHPGSQSTVHRRYCNEDHRTGCIHTFLNEDMIRRVANSYLDLHLIYIIVLINIKRKVTNKFEEKFYN